MTSKKDMQKTIDYLQDQLHAAETESGRLQYQRDEHARRAQEEREAKYGAQAEARSATSRAEAAEEELELRRRFENDLYEIGHHEHVFSNSHAQEVAVAAAWSRAQRLYTLHKKFEPPEQSESESEA